MSRRCHLLMLSSAQFPPHRSPGYGHISPSSAAGQIFCIVYSLLGIPISGLLLAGLSDFFAGNLLNFYDSKWQQKWGESRWDIVVAGVRKAQERKI